MSIEQIKNAIRDVPDFPKEGIIFKDITTVLSDPDLLQQSINVFVEQYKDQRIDKVAGIEARGFIFGAAVAAALGAGFVPIRKQGKLPYKTIAASYDLEYGSATIEMHVDAVQQGERVLLLDDLLATGGTAAAAIELLTKCGGEIASVAFLIELAFLNGREKLAGHEVFAPIVF